MKSRGSGKPGISALKMRDLTLRQLQIFSTVAHAGSLTGAAKQLELRQPSISQQINTMEKIVGGKLVRFIGGELRLTPAGQFLLEETHKILGAMERARLGLTDFFDGQLNQLSVGVLPSLARNLLVSSCAELHRTAERFIVDIVEMTPMEAIEQLTGRTIDLALVSGYAAAAKVATGLSVVHLSDDRQLLAVPKGMQDLTAIEDPERELTAKHLSSLQATIRYAFASEHSDRINRWYDQLWPNSNVAIRCRSYETALAFVERGLGTALVPEYAVKNQNRLMFDVDLYDMPLPKRELIALVPSQNANLPSVRRFLEVLAVTAKQFVPMTVRPTPRFAEHRLKPSGRPGADG